jgi:hypothetical protein
MSPPAGRLHDVNQEEWVRSELAAVTCEACGNAYASSRLRVLARRQGMYVVGLTCGSCGAAAVAMVAFEREGGAAGQPAEADGRRHGRAARARSEASSALAVSPAVDLDDVLDMHRFLEDFDGDFRQLFDTTLGGSSMRGRGA